jgi:hypothetical protein
LEGPGLPNFGEKALGLDKNCGLLIPKLGHADIMDPADSRVFGEEESAIEKKPGRINSFVFCSFLGTQ